MSGAKQARASDRSGRGPRTGTAKSPGPAAGKNGAASKNGAGRSGTSDRNGTARQGGGRRPAAAGAGASARGSAQAQTRKARDRARGRELAEQRASAAPTAIGPPGWLQLTTFVLSIAGLGVSVYMTIEHFTGNTTLACSSNSVINCGAVTTSPESMVFGVFPVAVLGLAFYVVVTALMTPWAWQIQRREVGLLRLVSMVAGMGFVMYLIYAEVVQIQDICEYCTGVHVITFLLFCITVFSAAIWGLGKPAAKAKAA